MMEKILLRHNFKPSKCRRGIIYALHNITYGGIYVEIRKHPTEPWREIARVEIKEVDLVLEFESAKKLEKFLNRIERNTAIYGFRMVYDKQLVYKELKEAYQMS